MDNIMDKMTVLNATILFIALFSLAILIERLIEILKSAFDLMDSRLQWRGFWTRRANALKARLEKRLHIHQYMDDTAINRVLASFSRLLLGPGDDYRGTIPTISGDLVRVLYVKIGTKAIGMACGIALALSFDLDILTLMIRYLANDSIPQQAPVLNQIVTGAIIGLGSSPVHKLITAIERKRESRGKGEMK